ncbi:hypothetical protein NLC29_00075 [Candidatus Aminicenantes bacterium AH-873-B07]|nr:hypothetical protein [Candidatus Aminicenantes bacterium AH-873-B07]
MDEFYCYRNCTAHGNPSDWNGKIWTPLKAFFIANKIFIDSIRVKFEKENLLNIDNETRACIDATDELIMNGNIFEKNFKEIISEQIWDK